MVDFKSIRFWIWTAAIFVTWLDKREVFYQMARAPLKFQIDNLTQTGVLDAIPPHLKRQIESFPKTEREYFISAPPPVDGFSHQRLIEMAFPRVYSPNARCGFTMDIENFHSPQILDLEKIKYNVACRR